MLLRQVFLPIVLKLKISLLWSDVAEWWADRFDNGGEALTNFKGHRDFDKFHYELTRNPLADNPQIDVFYDPALVAKVISTVGQKQAQLLI